MNMSHMTVQHPMVALNSWTCKDVQGGYSTFCDNIWPVWEIDWVNTTMITMWVVMYLVSWMIFYGFFLEQRKEAFDNPL
jgi:hypothetical protein